MHYPFIIGDAEEISDCLEAGADPNARLEHQLTPLHVAAATAVFTSVITILVKAGADVHATLGDSGVTPLAVAVVERNLEAVTALIAAGANPHWRIGSNKTPYQVASEKNDPALMAAFGVKAVAAFKKEVAAAAREKEKQIPTFKQFFDEHEPAAARAWEELEKQRQQIPTFKQFFDEHEPAAARAWEELEKQRQAAATAARKKPIEKQVLAARVSCDKWNTAEFFRHAESADVSRCLKTKDPNTRDDKGRTPLHAAAMVSKKPAVVAALAKGGAELDARDREGRTPLHLVAWFGNSPAVVTALVKAGADLNALDGKGRTPLEFAEKFSESPALVNALKKAENASVASAGGACGKWNTAAFFRDASLADLSRCLETEDPDARNENGRTPLHYAAQGRAPAFVTALAKAGAKINARDKRGGWTPLHLAAWFGKSRMVVQALLDVGADPEAKDDAGRIPWDYLNENPVLKDFDPQVVRVSCKDWNTASFFEWASAADLSRCLNGGAKVNARDETGATPLHLAARHGKTPDVVTALVEAGAAVDTRDETGATALHAAAVKSTNPAVLQALLDVGADPEAIDDAGRTPWDYVRANPALNDADFHSQLAVVSCEDWNTASFFERADAAELSRCIKAGAKVDARDETGATPLHLVAQHGKSPAVVTALVEAGARVGARNETGATPLHTAAAKGTSPAVIQALLAAGADPKAKDEAGRTPWDYVKANAVLKKTGIQHQLTEVSCENWNTALFFEYADATDVSRCLKAGVKVSARNETEATPLHIAASKSEVPAVVQVLLDAGADPAARDGQGKSPWDRAKANPALKGTEVYWRLNEGRFN